jgi:uncharacterized membrane protein
MNAREVPLGADAGRCRIVLRPNRSLSPLGMIATFLLVATLTAPVAFIFLAQGAWMVLVFAVLELGAVAAMLLCLRRHAEDCESITVDDAQVEIVTRVAGRESRCAFQRYWARLNVEPGRTEWHPTRVTLRSHGREVELGTGVDTRRRLALAEDLQALVGHAY